MCQNDVGNIVSKPIGNSVRLHVGYSRVVINIKMS